MNNRSGFVHPKGRRRLRTAAGIVFAALMATAGSLHALTLAIREIGTGQEKSSVEFGNMTVSISHHTGFQYLDIGHPASVNRKVFLYTANQEAYGKAEAGLVSTSTRAGLPFFFRNYPSLPADGSFQAADESLWTLFLENSAADFETRKQAETLLTPTNGRSLVYMGTKIDGAAAPADFRAHIIVEEWSEFEVDAPVLSHTPFNDVLLTGASMGVSAVVVEESTPVAVTFHYRFQNDPPNPFVDVPATVSPDPSDPNRYFADAALPTVPSVVAVLEYYFTAVDRYTNDSRLPAASPAVFQANLIPEFGTVTRPMTSAGGQVDVAVGDPRRPGFSLSVPSGTNLQNVSVSQEDPALLPPFNTLSPVSAFEVGPSGTRFNRVATLTIPYLDEDDDGLVDGTGADEKLLRIYWFDGIEWRVVGGNVDVVNNQVTASISHFSFYGLFPFSPSLSAESVRPDEKIITPNGDNKEDLAVFNNINLADGPIEIQIYNVRGERVRQITTVAHWDGRDDDGKVVENGTYVYRLTGQGLTVTGMIAVAR